MKLAAISIDSELVGMEAFRRIQSFGRELGNSFYGGLKTLKGLPNYRFIMVEFVGRKLKEDFFYDSYDKVLYVREFIDVPYFLSLSEYEQIKYGANKVFLGLRKIFEKDKLSLILLEEAYQSVLKQDFYYLWDKKYVKGVHIVILYRREYSRETVKIQIIKQNKILSDKQLFVIEPISEKPEHEKRKRSLIEMKGLLNEDIFRITYGIFEYDLNLKTFEIDIIQHDELKDEFFDWDKIKN